MRRGFDAQETADRGASASVGIPWGLVAVGRALVPAAAVAIAQHWGLAHPEHAMLLAMIVPPAQRLDKEHARAQALQKIEDGAARNPHLLKMDLLVVVGVFLVVVWLLWGLVYGIFIHPDPTPWSSVPRL